MTQNEATSLALDTVMVKGIISFQEDVTMETVARMSPVKKVFLEVLPNS